jgi:hypothetical protein
MAGFDSAADDLSGFRFVAHPAVTLLIDLGDTLVADDASGRELRGSIAAGLAPAAVLRGRGRDIECLQVRLPPAVAHAALAGFPELSGTVTAFDDLWGGDAARLRERLRASSSWEERFALAEAALGSRLEAGRAVDPEVGGCGPGSGRRWDSLPSGQRNSSVSITRPTAWPPATAPPWWRRTAGTPTSPTSTARSSRSPG